jgi:hypothetical protein
MNSISNIIIIIVSARRLGAARNPSGRHRRRQWSVAVAVALGLAAGGGAVARAADGALAADLAAGGVAVARAAVGALAADLGGHAAAQRQNMGSLQEGHGQEAAAEATR